jgi:hypothetical protein
MLTRVKARLDDTQATIRATVVAAIRYTFTDTDESYDELLSPLIVEFLSLVHDLDLVSGSALVTLILRSFFTDCPPTLFVFFECGGAQQAALNSRSLGHLHATSVF